MTDMIFTDELLHVPNLTPAPDPPDLDFVSLFAASGVLQQQSDDGLTARLGYRTGQWFRAQARTPIGTPASSITVNSMLAASSLSSFYISLWISATGAATLLSSVTGDSTAANYNSVLTYGQGTTDAQSYQLNNGSVASFVHPSASGWVSAANVKPHFGNLQLWAFDYVSALVPTYFHWRFSTYFNATTFYCNDGWGIYLPNDTVDSVTFSLSANQFDANTEVEVWYR